MASSNLFDAGQGGGLHSSPGDQGPTAATDVGDEVPQLPNTEREVETTPDGVSAVDAPEPTRRQPKPPKLPPLLARYLPIAGVTDETIVRLGGAEISVMEVRGLEVEQPIMGAFAAVLNALEFPIQLLVRQHPPRLGALRDSLEERRPSNLAQGVAEASASLGEFLSELEERPGVVDRRFYAICQKARAGELQGLLIRAGFAVFPLKDRALRLLVESTLRGCAPPAPEMDGPMAIGLGRGHVNLGERMSRSYQLTRWPRTLPLGYMQRVLALGLPMDLSIHISPIATPQAVRTLEWQRVKMESGIAISLKRGKSTSPETEIALEDASRLRDEVHRGRERLFNASFSITIYGDTTESIKERGQQLRGLFAGSMATLDKMTFRQREGHHSTLPLALNAGASWRTVDTTTLAYLLPFAPPDLDTRKGTLFGLDLRSGSVVTFDYFDQAFLNANTVVMARSGAGKSFSTKLGLLRGISRGIVYYVIDPEGEYAHLAQAAGGRVLTPGIPGHGLNPFVLQEEDESEVLQRVGGLRRLIEVMVGERFSPEQRATLDEALTAYYTTDRAVTGFQDFFAFLQSQGYHEMASLLRPFSTGSLRHLLTDQGADLLGKELPITVFNLRLWNRSCVPPPPWSAPRRCGPWQRRTPAPGCWWWTRCGASCSTPKAPPPWSPSPSAPASTGWASSPSPRTSRTSSARTPAALSSAIQVGCCFRTPPSSYCFSRTRRR